MNIIERNTIGEVWEDAFDFIIKNGNIIQDDDQELIEILHLNLIINEPDDEDPVALTQDSQIREWMNNNFTEIKKVPELNNSWSYGWRLYYYLGINQVQWVVEKLKKKPESKSATISMLLEPGKESYVPCVSLLDFKIRNDRLLLTATCRSLDMGRKAIHNLCNLAAIAKTVAKNLNLQHYKLIIHITSAHIYKKDLK